MKIQIQIEKDEQAEWQSEIDRKTGKDRDEEVVKDSKRYKKRQVKQEKKRIVKIQIIVICQIKT